MDEYELKLASNLSDEDLDKIYDNDFENTNSIIFNTRDRKEVEFVKIVRCKNCIHYGEFLSTEPKHEKYCNMLDWFPDEDDFCSRGEVNETD